MSRITKSINLSRQVNFHNSFTNVNKVAMNERNIGKVSFENPNKLNFSDKNIDKVNWHYLCCSPYGSTSVANILRTIDLDCCFDFICAMFLSDFICAICLNIILSKV